ncbi:hypothetical protein CC80DRAFT_243115 [Byssothecium circinans]|uniref:Uncharacterized protein n=1 Tax=Byssothecium circinans TaxID=147558 RepID=A0A6A5TDD7_9PLEO|nr:hypothetical protein CC80DRAFT_243115 [Byssothecium circinans]
MILFSSVACIIKVLGMQADKKYQKCTHSQPIGTRGNKVLSIISWTCCIYYTIPHARSPEKKKENPGISISISLQHSPSPTPVPAHIWTFKSSIPIIIYLNKTGHPAKAHNSVLPKDASSSRLLSRQRLTIRTQGLMVKGGGNDVAVNGSFQLFFCYRTVQYNPYPLRRDAYPSGSIQRFDPAASGFVASCRCVSRKPGDEPA